MLKFAFCLLTFVCFLVSSKSQRIVYSQTDKNDVKTMDYDIIGKMNNHYLIHKNNRNEHNITVYDSEMKVVRVEKLDFLPLKVLSSDILSYKDFFYFFYQYQKKNIVYCMAAKLDGDAKLMGEPKELDTTAINFFASDKLDNIIWSEDKQKIMVFKVNTKNADKDVLTTSLFDGDLNLIHRSRINITMAEKNDFLQEFSLDNDGTFVFLKPAGSSQEDNIAQASLMVKNAESDSLFSYNLPITKIYLDNIKIKIDNTNKHFLLTSFYSKVKRGNIDGLYCLLWDKAQARELFVTTSTFSDEMRNDAKSEGSPKAAFNDFYVQNILIKKDGGFAIAAESVYSSSRGNYNNRWDYYNYPYMSPYGYYNYYSYSPLYNYYYPWYRWGGMPMQINRFYADNIAVMSFDSTANLIWSNVIHKSQYDDYTDNFIGYGTMNTGTQFHFLYNQSEKRTLLLTDQSITPDGQVNHAPTLHELSKDYQFMPRFSKQVSSHELIIPCQYRNFVCFAKVEF
jgi:hypothetical protein